MSTRTSKNWIALAAALAGLGATSFAGCLGAAADDETPNPEASYSYAEGDATSEATAATPPEALEALLAEALGHVNEVQRRLEVEDWIGAQTSAAVARALFVEANGRLVDNPSYFGDEDFRTWEVRLEFAVRVMDATVAALSWVQAGTALGAAMETATEDEALSLLYSLEAILPSAERVARAYEEIGAWLDRLIAEEPGIAAAAGIIPEQAAGFYDIATQVREHRDQLEESIAEVRAELGSRYTSEDDRLLRRAEDAVPLPPGLVSAELVAFFDGFDANRDGALSIREAKDFYYRMEDHVAYRYDDEEATDTLPGLPVGDGRPGADYWQTPDETFAEGAGDCEDVNALEVAFYNHWGVPAYQAYVNAVDPYQIDHAIAIVRVGATEVAFEAMLGDHPHYTFGFDNEFGIPPGVYMIIDNAYSDDFGFISTGIPPGQFQVHMVASLGEHFGLDVQ